jgi:allophanate hydrolase subunit 2
MDIEGKKFKLSNRMSRTGALIEGSKLEVKNGTSDIISDGVSAGTIQLPKDGNMYILLEDSQRIGGYARILNLESSSLWAFTQLMPGDEFKIVITTIEDAQKRLKELNSILFDNNIFSERLFAEKNINVEGELINVKIFGESKEYIYINNMPLKIDF